MSGTTAREALAIAGATGATMLAQVVAFGAFMRLFDGATAGLVPGVVPWVLFLGYVAALVATLVWAFARHGGRALPLGAGVVVLLVASIPFGGGCEVAGGGADPLSLIPAVELRGLSLVFRSGTGCTYPVVAPLLGAGYALFVAGLRVIVREERSR